MSTVALIDGDSIAYYAGSSSTEEECDYAVDFKISQIISATEATKYELYIEEWRKPKNNLRDKFFDLSEEYVKDHDYKGNRRGKQPPPFLNRARERMVKNWEAQVLEGYESEDMVIIRAFEVQEKFDPVICHIDKDLLQYPLKYYNYNTGRLSALRPATAALNLWRQVCTGDMTDNIPGIPKIGQVKAKKAVVEADTAKYEAAKLYKSKGLSYDYFIEQYNLIKIRDIRTKDKLFPLTLEEWEQLDG